MAESQGASLRLSTVGQVIGIFTLAGVGIGATGGIAVNQLGGGGTIVGGILILVVLTIAFLLGPIIGLISGLRVGDEQGRSFGSYISSLVGSVAGYFVMILVVVLTISVVIAISGGGGSETAASQTSTTGDASGGLPIGEYIVPIITVALPTGITSLGGVYFGGNTAQGSGIKLPKKYIAGTIAVVVILGAGAIVAPSILSSEPQEPQLEVDGTTDFSYKSINADGTITNPTGSEITNSLTVELVIDGNVVRTKSEEITVQANGAERIFISLIEVSDLTQSQRDEVNQDNMELRFRINDVIVDTVSPVV